MEIIPFLRKKNNYIRRVLTVFISFQGYYLILALRFLEISELKSGLLTRLQKI